MYVCGDMSLAICIMCAGPVALVICFRQTHTHAHTYRHRAELVHVKRYNFYRDHLIFYFFFPEPIWGIVEIPVRPKRPSYIATDGIPITYTYTMANCSFNSHSYGYIPIYIGTRDVCVYGRIGI